MPKDKKNPNTIPDAHVEEDHNTPGDDSGEQVVPTINPSEPAQPKPKR